MNDHDHNNIMTMIHHSTFSSLIIPLGNFIVPFILWIVNKDKSKFINQHGKQALNFQISILLYLLMGGIIALPIFALMMLMGLNLIILNTFNEVLINFFDTSYL